MGRAYEVRKASIQKTGAAKAKLYSTYAKEIYLAAKKGVPEIESNISLKRLVEKAKKEQVPADIINRAIDKAKGAGQDDYEKVVYEGFGPGSSTLIIECLTDNVNRTVGMVRAAFNKVHKSLGVTNSVSYNYDYLGVLSFKYNDEEAVAPQAGYERFRVSPGGKNCAAGCSFCSFSNEVSQYKNGTYTKEKMDNYLAPLIRKMVHENGIRKMFITGGNPSLDDMEKWTEYVKECVKVFRKEAPDGLVDIMMTPRSATKYVDNSEEYSKYLEYLYKDIGIDTISANMEIFSQEYLDKYCPPNGYIEGTSKSEIGSERYKSFLKAAVSVFGPFKVRSALIVGLEPIENTKEAIRSLINMGCYVTLSPFKPPECSRYGVRLPNEPSLDTMLELNKYLEDTLALYLSTKTDTEKQEYLANINLSLNAHSRHNTGNINGPLTPLDPKEIEIFKNGGYDPNLARNIADLQKLKSISI